jgi:hypothetical protein
VELAEKDFPPGFGEFLARIDVARIGTSGAEIGGKGDGFGLDEGTLGTAVEVLAFGVGGVTTTGMVLKFSLDYRQGREGRRRLDLGEESAQSAESEFREAWVFAQFKNLS